MKRPLGCLSGIGLIAALVTLLVIGGVVALTGGGWFSPGALNAQAANETLNGVASHAETGGSCSACHPAPWSGERMADRCAECHAAMRQPDSHLAQFHALLWGDDPEQPCRACHPEHRGAQAALTEVSVVDFPHERTGFSLAAHETMTTGGPFACADCHADNLSVFAVRTCADCHVQIDRAYMAIHATDFGAGCLDCHDGVDRYAGFDHSRTQFALDGAHAQVRCGECHEGGRLAGTSADCSGCHEEPPFHRGLFAHSCDACHNTVAWQPARFDEPHIFPIDHGETGPSPCRTCHPDALATYTCYGCHEHTPAEILDEHDDVLEDITDCVRCHPTGREDES